MNTINEVAKRLEAVKKDPRATYISQIDESRHILKVPMGLLNEHSDISKVRHKSPEDIDLLKDSMKRTGGTSIYTPCAFVELGPDGCPIFWIADGHQRIRAAKANKEESIIVQYISRWLTTEDVLRDVMGLQYARYEMTDDDIISVLQTKKLLAKEISTLTGKSETTISRLAKLADHDWLRSMVKDGVLGYNNAASLIDATNGNLEKLAAIKNTLESRYQDAKSKADFWKNKIKTDRRNWDQKAKDKARVATYFKDEDWKNWQFVVETEEPVQNGEGCPILNLSTATKVGKGVWIGETADWNKEFAVHGFFEAKIDDVATEDITTVLASWDDIRAKIEAIRDRRLHAEATTKYPIPSANPVKDLQVPKKPAKQKPQMKVEK